MPHERLLVFAEKKMRKKCNFKNKLTSLEGVTVQGVALDQDLKCSIIDRIISEGGDQFTGYIPRSFTQFANELRDRKRRKICMVQILARNANISKA